MMAPTMACVMETGIPALVIQYTVKAAVRATMNEPARALTAPRFPRP